MWLKNHINYENLNEYKKNLFFEKMVKNKNITTKMEKKSDRTECGSDTKHIPHIITDMLIFKTYQ